MLPRLPDDASAKPQCETRRMPHFCRRGHSAGHFLSQGRGGLAALELREVEQHKRPADGSQLLVDGGAGAPLVAAPVEYRRRPALPPLARAPVENDLYRLVPREGLLDVRVELPPVAGDDEEVLHDRHLLGHPARDRLPDPARAVRLLAMADVKEAREGAPRAASAGRAGRRPELEALVAVDAERQPL